jgi:hypothetical protein
MSITINQPKPARHMEPWKDEEKRELWRLAGLEGKDFDRKADDIAAASQRNPSAVVDAYYRFVHAKARSVLDDVPTHFLVRVAMDRLSKDAPL